MTQYVINIGTIPNDGTGDPLRTAFNETNLNFDQVFAAGPVLSNVRIANNSILTTNTNGNLVLAPNGIGVVQSNVSIVPNISNIRNLGSADRRWSTTYMQYANISGGLAVANLTATGNVVVGGNLSVTGNIIYIGNLITDAKTIQLANTAGTANAADGSGITVGANDNIATMLYSSASNSWVMNIGIDTPNIVVNNISSDDSTFVTVQDGLDVQGSITAETLSVTGNITGNYFIGNGSQLTGLPASYSNANVVTLLAAFGSNTLSTTGNVSGGFIFGNISQATGFPATYGNANVATFLAAFGSNTISTTGNITSGNIGTGIITLTNGAVLRDTAGDAVAFGDNAGLTSQGNQSVAIGQSTGTTSQGASAVAIGSFAGQTTQGIETVAIGYSAASNAQSQSAVAVGYAAGQNVQGNAAVAIGFRAGNNLQGNLAVAVGNSAGKASQGFAAVAIGQRSGETAQGVDTVAVGNVAGSYLQSANAVAIGAQSGAIQQGNNAVAIGYGAGFSAQAANSIIINATGNVLNQATANTFTVAPVRNDVANIGNVMFYNATSKEITYGNTISVAGNITGGNLISPTLNNSGNISVVAGSNTWIFESAGTTIFPTLTVTRGDRSGTLTGQALLFGDSTQEALISTPNGTNAIADSQRIVINPGAGYANTTGEGGDIYLYAGRGGDAGGTGGDVKIRGGLGPADGAGGYLDIMGGEAAGNGVGGRIDIQGGESANSNGGAINIVGGQGRNGGDVNILSGNGTAGPGGTLTLQGGVSSNGLAAYGNVIVNSGASSWQFNNTGNLTLPGNTFAVNYANGTAVSLGGNYGNANVATFLAAYGSNTISTTGNITAGNLIGNINITGNVQGTSANVTLVAGVYSTVFDNTGNLTLPGNTFAVNYANNTPVDVVTRFESLWTVPTGTSTQSFTVTGNNSYQMWVEGNIPNGIIVWNATVTVTNTNVPAIGQQFAWNYEGGGNILMLTSIPAQIIGTAGAIANAQPAVANTNVFSFGINNTSGGNVTVRYGWIQIS
jgi:hypothetical protein